WHARFRRGFLEAIDLPALDHHASNWEEAFGQLCAGHPVRDVNVNGIWSGVLSTLARREELRRVESLSVLQWDHGSQQGMAQDPQVIQEMDAVLRSPRLARLRRLALRLSNVSVEQGSAWLGLPVFARIEAINDLSGHPADGQFLRALARGEFPHLRELSL